MNYRDFFKKGSKSVKSILPEGVDAEQLKLGIRTEREHTKDAAIAAKIAMDHLNEDPKYYEKLSKAGLENENCDVDENGGLPLVGGALAIPHVGQPIHMSKIIQVGGEFKNGKPATGALSGYTDAGVTVTPDNEPITAGGKKVDSSLASKTVGGQVVPGEGQKQGGPNTKGSIAGTPKLNESRKSQAKQILKEALKEICYNKTTGKWEMINENTVDMKMGPSYKVVQPTLAKTSEDDFARTNQYDPEITEMYGNEEIDVMESRREELMTAKRNLSEDELSEMKQLTKKLERISEARQKVNENDSELDAFVKDVEDTSKFVEKNPKVAKRWGTGGKMSKSAEDYLKRVHADIDAKKPAYEKGEDDIYDDKFDTTSYKSKDKPPLPPGDPNFLKRKKKDAQEPEIDEASGGTVQHRSFRTVDDLPQNKDVRWGDEIDESTEPKQSETAKKIKKSAQGGKKSSKPGDLKFKQKSSKTSKSGIKKSK